MSPAAGPAYPAAGPAHPAGLGRALPGSQRASTPLALLTAQGGLEARVRRVGVGCCFRSNERDSNWQNPGRVSVFLSLKWVRDPAFYRVIVRIRFSIWHLLRLARGKYKVMLVPLPVFFGPSQLPPDWTGSLITWNKRIGSIKELRRSVHLPSGVLLHST